MRRYRVYGSLAAFVFLIAYLVAPVFALSGLFASLRDADAGALPRYIDFASLRTSLKAEMNALIATDPEIAKTPLPRLLTPARLDSLLDKAITPAGVAGFMRREWARPSKAVIDPSMLDLKHVKFEKLWRAVSIHGPFEFNIVQPDLSQTDQVHLVFRNGGVFDWKLVAVGIPARILSQR